MSLAVWLNNLNENDASVLAECIFLRFPNAVKDIRPLAKKRLEIYNMVAEGVNTAPEIARRLQAKPNNIATQLKMMVDDGYLKRDEGSYTMVYSVTDCDDIVGQPETETEVE